MGRFQRSLALAKESFAVLRSNPQLAWFPVISSFVTVILTISFAIPLFLASGGFDGLQKADRFPPGYYAVLAVFYLLSYFIVIFFNVGLVSCAHASLSGSKMNVSDGLAAAGRRLPAILGWTLVAATVGLILQMISERSGIFGKIVVAIVGGAWNLVTYFVVPIIAIEQGSPIAAIKKSGSMLKRTWGENLIGQGGIGLVLLLFALIPVVPFVFACISQSPAAILIVLAVSVIYWLALAAVGSSLSGIYRTALYLYAETGTVPVVFDSEALQGAFRQGKPSVVNRWMGRG